MRSRFKDDAKACDATFGFGEFGHLQRFHLETESLNHIRRSNMAGIQVDASLDRQHIGSPRLFLRDGDDAILVAALGAILSGGE